MLKQALEKAPHNIGARLNHVADLLHEDKAEEALALLEAAGPPLADPEAHRHWLLQIAGILLLLDRAHDARQHLDALAALGPIPAALAPLWHVRQTALALAGRDPRSGFASRHPDGSLARGSRAPPPIPSSRSSPGSSSPASGPEGGITTGRLTSGGTPISTCSASSPSRATGIWPTWRR